MKMCVSSDVVPHFVAEIFSVPVLDSWKRMEVKGKKVSPEKATCKDSPSAIEEPMVFDGGKDIGRML